MRARLLLAGLLAMFLVAAPAALADGDPASDYLLGGSTYLSPFDSHIPKAEQAKLVAMLASAKKQGFPLKVALIATRYDLGSVPSLFKTPQTYAHFLAEEDFYYWKTEVLVVTPSGFGIYKAKMLPAADRAIVAKLKVPAKATGPELMTAVQGAVKKLAARRGLTLATTPVAKRGGSESTERVEIAGGAIVLCLIGGGIWLLLRRRRTA
ncbi:MAG TPA: hypothetical protein VH063_03755 [Gaiellaceae bacterium]|jgi:hypothetical protein|nr:hypothetical protein [Gaiellaceae bacterium]